MLPSRASCGSPPGASGRSATGCMPCHVRTVIGIGLAWLAAGAAACGPPPKPVVSVTASPARAETAQPPAPAAVDPLDTLLAESERQFALGRSELELGHLDRARAAFDAALDVLLDAPGGTRVEPRLQAQFDRLVDRVSALEATALAAGDGFTEKPYEPASIDELLATSTFDAAAPAPELASAVRADLAGTAHDIPIPLNERVLRYVDLFQGRLRDWFDTALHRSGRYLPMIQNVFRAEGLPLDLAFVPIVESAFSPNALSRAKAKGMWQFMRGTAVENGLRHDWFVDERADPEKATRAAANYLKSLAHMFDDDWHLVLASYNGGPGKVQRAMKRTRRDDFWALTQSSKALPRETREYVPMILAAIIIARNPSQYGFDSETDPPWTYEKVATPGPVDLRRIAEWASVPVSDIQALNPELRRWTTPIRETSYEVKVPVGTSAVVGERLAATPATEHASLMWHTVKKGETISVIARKFRVARSDLAEANRLSTRSVLRAGQALLIPRAPTTLLASRVGDERAPAPPAEVAASRQFTDAGVSPSVEQDETARLMHRVKKGDTLFAIARLYSTTVAQIRQWNRLRSTTLRPGDRLTIYRGRTGTENQ